MRTRVFAVTIAAFIIPLLTAHPAQAKKRHHHRHLVAAETAYSGTPDRNGEYRPVGDYRAVRSAGRRERGSGNCPRNLGCGCNLANYFHISGPQWRELWVARAWARVGRAASRGCRDCVAVLSRGRGGHVGVVRDYDANGNPVIYSYANGRLGWTTTTYSARRVIAYRNL